MNKKNAFTLIEVLVGIVILTILALGVFNINLKFSTNNQRIEIFTNSIISEIETVRNNSLIGRAAGSTNTVPDKWKIEFSTSGSGRMLTSYSGVTLGISNDLIIQNLYSIENINCTTDLLDSETGSIVFIGGEYHLDDDCFGESILTIDLQYSQEHKETIEFNSISGLIKR